MPCPFLTRLSANYVRNYGASMLLNYGQHCPVMSRLSSSLADSVATAAAPTATTTATTDTTDSNSLPDPSANKCPFLSKERDAVKEASLAVKEDVISLTDSPKDNGTFKYEDFFHEQIMRKKKDHSYRYVPTL